MLYYDELSIFDRILVAVNPVFRGMAKIMPSGFGPCAEAPPCPSAMLPEHNWVHKLLFSRAFKKVVVDASSLAALKEAASRGTVVYVTKGLGQFEFNFFNYLFLKEGLPLANVSNAITVRRFMKWRTFWQAVREEEAEITQKDRPKDPITDNGLISMVKDGQSALLAIPASGLVDDGIYGINAAGVLASLIETSRQSKRPVSIVPLDFLKSLRPGKAKRTTIDILFGDKESPGWARGFIQFWMNYIRRTEAVIGEPIDLSSFKNWEGGDNGRVAEKLRGYLLAAFNAKRKTITGPPVRAGRWFVHEVMSDENLDEQICRMAAEKNKPADDVRDLAAKYASEIAADVDYTYIEIAEKLLSFSLGRLFDPPNIDTEGLAKAKKLYESGPIVFVPNHKSHMDYLVLSYLMHKNGMTVPLIAAGMNLKFWPVGNIARHCGAYFIKRTFKDNALYKSVLETYLKILMREGYCQEFFIEGGRSRTGKLRNPKLGMIKLLSKASRDANVSGLHFIPVSITYDRVIESKSYADELAGGQKEKEKTASLIKLTRYLRRQKHRYGSIYIRFGEPVYGGPTGTGPSASEIADKICHEINRNIVATPTAVAAAALLLNSKRGVTIDEVKANWDAILAYLRFKGINMSTRFESTPATALDDAIEKLVHARLLIPHRNAVVPYLEVSEDRRVPLSYFKNNIVHFLVSLGIVSRILIKRLRDEKIISETELTALFETGRKLLQHEFRCATRNPVEEHVRIVLEFLLSQGAVTQTDNSICVAPKAAEICPIFAEMIAPFLETMQVGVKFLSRNKERSLNEKGLLMELMQAGNDLFILGEIKYREAVTKAGFEEAVRFFINSNLMSETLAPSARGKKIYTISAEPAPILNLKEQLEQVF